MSASSTTLPLPSTSFVGRARELSQIQERLATTRLLTLTGPGGSGKTRLALQAATLLSGSFQDGVRWVALSSLRDPGLLPRHVTQTLGLPRLPEQPALESLLQQLHSKKMLIVLDNCEHLIAGCAALAQQLLSQTSELRILATSREPLAIPGEVLYPVSGLALPAAGIPSSCDPQAWMQYDAVSLFVERVRARLPAFTITPDNAPAIVQLCRRLDGLPLALELASARSNILTIQQITERLDDRFSLLVSTQRGEMDARHRTLRASMDWSYDLLTPSEQALLIRLSVFADGCSLASAVATCAGDPVEPAQVLDLLSSLVNKSLVVAQTLQRGEARYSLLESLQQYAQDRLKESGEWSAVHDRYLQCFLELTEETVPKLSGPYQQLWLNWLEGEYSNVRAALAWSLESGRVQAGLRIAIAINQFWTIRDHVEEGLQSLEQLLQAAGERVSPAVHANALAYAAFLAGFRGNTAMQMRYGGQAVDLAHAAGAQGKRALVWALAAQAYAARAAGDYAREFALGEQVIQLNRDSGDRSQLGVVLSIYSFSAMALGKYPLARAMLDEALVLLREAGNPYRIAMALNFTGDLARCEQDYHRAAAAYEESISLLRELDAPRDLASALQNLGHTSLHLGDTPRAHALFREGLVLQQAQRNTPGIAECLIGFTGLALATQRPALGARLLASAVAIGGPRIASTWAATRLEYERALALTRARLGETEFLAEQAAGRALTLEQAVQQAQNLLQPVGAGHRVPDSASPLTARERQVAGLIARGMSNQEIADALVLSKRTIEKHVANILSKLDFTNRAQIMRWTMETDRVRPTD